jgi:hypothetical protein
MWKCTNCGSEIENDNLLSCWNCGYRKDGSPPEDQETLNQAQSVKVSPPSAGTRPPVEEMFASRRLEPASRHALSSGFVTALRIFGWIALCAGLFLSAFILFGGTISANPDAKEPSVLYTLVAAFTTAFQGTFIFVLCRVIADIADQVNVVRAELLSQRDYLESFKRERLR